MPIPHLTIAQRTTLVTLLCACPSVADSGTRDAIVAQLPDALRHGIARHAAPRVDVTNIVQRCLAYADGLDALVAAVHGFEGDSLPMQDLLRWLREELNGIYPDDQTAPNDVTDPDPARGQRLCILPATPPTGPVSNRWAVLVGINTYVDPAYARLRYCVNDVRALEERLTHLGYTVVCLHDQLDRDSHRFPTRDNVEAEVRRIADSAGPDDLLLVHVACHGVVRDGQRALILRDTRQRLPQTALPLDLVEQILRASAAQRCIVLLDACHVGLDLGRSLTDPTFLQNTFDLAEGFAVLAASTSQQIAQEWQAQQQGVFTYFLLEGLSGAADRVSKGFVTVDDLKNHVIDGLRRWNVQHGGPLQEPTARVEGIGDMIVADFRPSNRGSLI